MTQHWQVRSTRWMCVAFVPRQPLNDDQRPVRADLGWKICLRDRSCHARGRLTEWERSFCQWHSSSEEIFTTVQRHLSILRGIQRNIISISIIAPGGSVDNVSIPGSKCLGGACSPHSGTHAATFHESKHHFGHCAGLVRAFWDVNSCARLGICIAVFNVRLAPFTWLNIS
jgi:hypothetical protein